MIKAEVVFEDDYVVLHGKDIWLDLESMSFAIGCYLSNSIEELFASQEQAVQSVLEQGHEDK